MMVSTAALEKTPELDDDDDDDGDDDGYDDDDGERFIKIGLCRDGRRNPHLRGGK